MFRGLEVSDESILYKDTAVYRDGDFVILECARIFGTGWNVYRADAPGSDDFTKVNEPGSYFTSYNAAKNWLDDFKTAPHNEEPVSR